MENRSRTNFNRADSIAKSALILSMLTIFVKIIGLIKQAVISYYFGTSESMDVYLVVTDFVSEVGVMFFSSIAITLISIYDEDRENKDRRNEFVSNSFTGLLLFSVIAVMAISIFSRPLVSILAPGFSAEALYDAALKLRMVSILTINICISNICIAILNAEKRFGIAKSIGLIQSICIITACVLFERAMGIGALYYGFAVYYIIENIYLIINVKKHFSFKFGNPFKDARVKKLVRLSIPVFIGSAIVQINAMIDKAIASNLEAGSVSGMTYGHFIFSSIHSIIIASITTVLYSYFSNYVVDNNSSAVVQKTKNSILLLSALLIPICLCCCINGADIVRLIFGRGSFDENSIAISGSAFLGYSLGIFVIAIRDVFVQVLYAYQKTKITMINGLVGVTVNLVLSIVLSRFVGVFGIAVADSIAYAVLAVMSYRSVYVILPQIRECIIKRDVFVIAISLIVALVMGSGIKHLLMDNHYFIRLFIDCMVVFISYYLMLIAFKHESIKIVKNYISKHIDRVEA